MTIQVRAATPADVPELARVAAICFPLACPPAISAADIAAFVAANLSEERFTGYVDDAAHHVLVALDGDRIVGYAILVGHGGDPTELSKLYVLPDRHGGPVAAELMRQALDWATATGAKSVWLGVNRKNERAQRFYRKHGFEVTGTRSFQVGGSTESDFVMQRRL